MSEKQNVDRIGTFRGTIRKYGLREYKSGAIAMSTIADLTEFWDEATQQWAPWSEWNVEVQGDFFVVKKDGTLNQMQVEALMQYAAWDGVFATANAQAWKPVPCQFIVTEDEYEGVTRFRASWINAYDAIPGAIGNISAARAKKLQTQFGSMMRALAGSTTRNATKPEGAPPARAPEPAKEPVRYDDWQTEPDEDRTPGAGA